MGGVFAAERSLCSMAQRCEEARRYRLGWPLRCMVLLCAMAGSGDMLLRLCSVEVVGLLCLRWRWIRRLFQPFAGISIRRLWTLLMLLRCLLGSGEPALREHPNPSAASLCDRGVDWRSGQARYPDDASADRLTFVCEMMDDECRPG